MLSQYLVGVAQGLFIGCLVTDGKISKWLCISGWAVYIVGILVMFSFHI